ncbi:hypothetical protein [Limoniibacter endophyticus]|uniref:Uncharacterized protein n=1 Tax=Limoniibacter endophyticus TaxID=1565040 RepID=A0A8J3DJQ0_9HYPH|nr:hypothetical protein [Limoniibacter endophyticus]GHC79271.1 hypothetical protein GCM10010136_31690 [Limoniibacter endophyticus]
MHIPERAFELVSELADASDFLDDYHPVEIASLLKEASNVLAKLIENQLEYRKLPESR